MILEADRRENTLPPRWVLPFIVGLGISLRFIQWIWNTSYFHDEIALLRNIRGRRFCEYLGPLNNNQAAPPFFMEIEKRVSLLFGTDSERIMRLPALIASFAALVLFAALSRRVLRPWEAALALWLFTCSKELSYFASMLKPYEADVFIAIMLTWMAIEVERTRSIRRWLILCVTAAVAVWVSYPAILIFGGLSAALCIGFLGRNLSRVAAYVAGNVLVAIPFLLLMHWVESAQHTHMMDDYWGHNFVDFSHPARIPLWFITTLYKLCNFALKSGGLYLLPLAVAGLVAMIRSGRWMLAAIIAGPLVMNLLAAALHRYPFEGRLTLYLIPSVFLLAGNGAGVVYDWMTLQLSIVWALIPGGAIALAVLGVAIDNAIRPQVFTDYRPMVRAIRARAQSDDVVYAPYTAEFTYYWPQVGRRARPFDPDYADEIGSRRFWIAWSHPRPEDLKDLDAMRRWAGTFAAERDSYIAAGNYAYLYEVNSTPPHMLAIRSSGKVKERIAANDPFHRTHHQKAASQPPASSLYGIDPRLDCHQLELLGAAVVSLGRSNLDIGHAVAGLRRRLHCSGDSALAVRQSHQPGAGSDAEARVS